MECLNYIKDFHQCLVNFRQNVKHCNEHKKQKLLNKIISEEDKCDNCETWFSNNLAKDCLYYGLTNLTMKQTTWRHGCFITKMILQTIFLHYWQFSKQFNCSIFFTSKFIIFWNIKPEEIWGFFFERQLICATYRWFRANLPKHFFIYLGSRTN